MAESKKSPRPKGPRSSGPSGRSGKPGGGSKPKGAPRGRGKGASDERDGGWSSTPPKGKGGSSKGPSKGPAKGPRKPPAKAPRAAGGHGRPKDDAPAKRESSRVDDFDFGDLDLSDMEPAAFPKPARPAKGAPGQPGQSGQSGKPGKPRGESERAPRPERGDRPARAPRAAAAAEGEAPALEEGKSVTAGRNAVRELLEESPRRVDGVFVRKGQRDAKVQEIVALADANRIKVQFVDDAVLRRLYPGTHQGVAAVTAAVEYAELDALIAAVSAAPLPVLLALDKVQDPGNLGAIARTAWALGAAGIIVPRHGGAYLGSGAMRASAGALHHLPVARVTNMSQALEACAEAGLAVLCADASGEDINTARIPLPAVLVLGGEEKGVRHGVAKHCELKLAIPLKRDFDSLNVAQAAAICLARLGRE